MVGNERVAFPLRPNATRKSRTETTPESRDRHLAGEKGETWSSSLTCHEGWTSEEQLRDDVNR